MKNFIYHYFATYQLDNKDIVLLDGIASMENEIKTIEDFRYLKKLIEPLYFEITTIRNLSLLGKG